MQNDCFRTAVVGCGAIAPNHLYALADDPRVKTVALVDPIVERAEAMRQKYAKDARIYTDYTEMLDKERPDVVHICTPHHLHASMAIAALERDIHVYLEKPMCRTREEIPLLLAAAEKSRARITVSFQNRFNPSTLAAMKIAEEDGGVLRGYGSVFWDRGDAYYTESGWRGRYATEGGGVLINQAIHTLDLLCLFLGKPISVTATTANHHLKGVIEVEDSAEGKILFEGGKNASFYATTAYGGGCETTIFLETAHHKLEIRSPYLFSDREKVDIPHTLPFPVGKECYGAGHKTMIEAFYTALAEGKDTPVPPSEAQYALRILLAAYASQDEETPI